MKRRPLAILIERDIDVLLVEELNVCPEFATWWIGQTGAPATSPITPIGAFHSVSHSTLGESDIVLLYSDASGARHAVLIEDKIDAPAQLGQADRYRQRGLEGKANGAWADFRTCLCAPRRYLQSSSDAAKYSAKLAYEDIREWFLSTGDLRHKYRGEVLNCAIEENKRGYTKKVDQQVTAFWRAYWQCSRVEFPELEMVEPGPRAAGSGWIELHPKRLSRDRGIFHKMTEGFVDLSIANSAGRVGQLLSAVHPFGKDLDVVQTGKSGSVRLHVKPLDILREFDEQRDAAREGMRAAYRLLFLSPVFPARPD